jgi:hypothetical protein
MPTTLPTIERMLEPLTACLTPEVAQRIVDLRLDDPSTLERLDYLREKANEGTLSEEERAEYEGFVAGNDLLMLIKDQARSVLQHG